MQTGPVTTSLQQAIPAPQSTVPQSWPEEEPVVLEPDVAAEALPDPTVALADEGSWVMTPLLQ